MGNQTKGIAKPTQKKLNRQERMTLSFVEFVTHCTPPVAFNFAVRELVMYADTTKMNEDSRQSVLILQEFLEDMDL